MPEFDPQLFIKLTTSITGYSTKYADRLYLAANFIGDKIQENALGFGSPSSLTFGTVFGILGEELLNPKELDDPQMDKYGTWRYPNGDQVLTPKHHL